MNPVDYFKGKNITVMGLGLLGGIGDIKFLAESGADIIVTDLKSEKELEPSISVLQKFPNVRYTIGRHELSDFSNRDLIIKAPSTPLDSIYIAEARKNGIQVTMWAALFSTFAREAGATIVGVTGTRGKTTTTEMIVSILRGAGGDVLEGGNLRGTSILSQIEKVTNKTITVLELDSWKLQGFGEEHLSPGVAVFTTFYPDHMNYYGSTKLDSGESMDTYLADKANIFLYQEEEDTLILGKQCAPTVIDAYGEIIESKIVIVDESKLPDSWTLQIPGVHNRYNAALALAAARALDIADVESKKALESFAGVPGRLELVREVGGVKIYNDTTSTTPEATLAALHALAIEDVGHPMSHIDVGRQTSNIILIMGGADKSLDMNKLLYEIPRHTKRVILLTGTGTNRVLEFLPGASVFDNLGNAVREAFASASPGDIILFSPAFASFGMFKNEYDRGNQFNELVQKYGN